MSASTQFHLVFTLTRGAQQEIRHHIDIDLEIKPDPLGGWIIEQNLPEEQCEHATTFIGRGKTHLTAVLDWLRKVNGSVDYIPAYKLTEFQK